MRGAAPVGGGPARSRPGRGRADCGNVVLAGVCGPRARQTQGQRGRPLDPRAHPGQVGGLVRRGRPVCGPQGVRRHPVHSVFEVRCGLRHGSEGRQGRRQTAAGNTGRQPVFRGEHAVARGGCAGDYERPQPEAEDVRGVYPAGPSQPADVLQPPPRRVLGGGRERRLGPPRQRQTTHHHGRAVCGGGGQGASRVHGRLCTASVWVLCPGASARQGALRFGGDHGAPVLGGRDQPAPNPGLAGAQRW